MHKISLLARNKHINPHWAWKHIWFLYSDVNLKLNQKRISNVGTNRMRFGVKFSMQKDFSILFW